MKKIYIQKLTWANLFLVRILNVYNDVYVWKTEVPKKFAVGIKRFFCHDLFTSDEWLLLNNNCHQVWKDDVFPKVQLTSNSKLLYKYTELDFTTRVLQEYAIKFEDLFLFLKTVEKHRLEDNSAELTCYGYLANSIPYDGVDLPKKIALTQSRLFIVLDYINELIISLGYASKTISGLLRVAFKAKINLTHYRVLWTGVSPQEVPDSDDSLTFFWAVEYEGLPKSEVLYFLPLSLKANQIEYLKKKNINYITSNELYRVLSIYQKLMILNEIITKALFSLLVKPSYKGCLIFRFFVSSVVWYELQRKILNKYYVTTISWSWPEKSELSVMNSLGVETIVWAYSANTIRPSSNSRFREVRVNASVLAVKEFWLWTSANVRFFRDRLVSSDTITEYKLKSCMMCGNRNNLFISTNELKDKLQIPLDNFVISIFDVPAVGSSFLDRFNPGPPLISVNYSNEFFHGIKLILEKFENITIVLKLKREINDPLREYPEVLSELADKNGYWMNSGRVVLVDTNIDPYIPISICDASIGMTFTSPVLVAISSGRYGVYYDPINISNCTPEVKLTELTIQNEDALLDTVNTWISNLNNKVSLSSDYFEDVLPTIKEFNFKELNSK